MRPLGRLHIQVALALVFQDCGVARVSQGAGVAVAHPRQIILIPTEGLRHRFGFVAAVAVVYDLPNCIVLNHLLSTEIYAEILGLFLLVFS